jgi:hypothetical protein
VIPAQRTAVAKALSGPPYNSPLQFRKTGSASLFILVVLSVSVNTSFIDTLKFGYKVSPMR